MISIAMATYNGSKYIRQQLDSLLYQTLPFDELIICDDRSVDKTVEILQEYACNDTRIKIIINEQNLGFNYNFQKALSLCTGDYIAICDQDDIWLPKHLEILNDLLCSGASLAVGGTKFIDINGNFLTNKTMAYTRKFPISHIPDDSDIFRFVCYYMNPFQGASMMVRKEFLSSILPLPKSAYIYDVWFTMCASLYGSLYFNPEVITLWRRHEDNATNNSFNHKFIRTFFGHIIKSGSLNNRGELLCELYKRFNKKLNQSTKSLLYELIRWNSSRDKFWGRLGNAIKESIFYLKIHY